MALIYYNHSKYSQKALTTLQKDVHRQTSLKYLNIVQEPLFNVILLL